MNQQVHTAGNARAITIGDAGTRWREVGDVQRHRGEGVRAGIQAALAECKRVELMEEHGGLTRVTSFQRRMLREF